MLGVDRVGVDDDFFDLGGDSLAAVELITGISERFGLDVPSSTLLDAPDVGRLASRLGQRRHRSSSTIVPLRTEPEREAGSVPKRGESVPLFCVTGDGAPALSLRALADALDTRPVFGIQARGLEERALPDRSVVGAAKRAVREIRAGWPAGPHAIAGYSFGALVAFEAARRMEADGQDSGMLVILDGIAPRRTRSRRQPIRRRARHAELMTTGLLPRRGLRQYERFLDLSVLMAGNYTPRGTYGGALLLVRTHLDVPDDAQGRFMHRDLGWSSVVTGPITIVDVPGDHLAILRSPVVAAVADALREALA